MSRKKKVKKYTFQIEGGAFTRHGWFVTLEDYWALERKLDETIDNFKNQLIDHCKTKRNKCYTFACPFFNGIECEIDKIADRAKEGDQNG